jgi:hypothetical protein
MFLFWGECNHPFFEYFAFVPFQRSLAALNNSVEVKGKEFPRLAVLFFTA